MTEQYSGFARGLARGDVIPNDERGLQKAAWRVYQHDYNGYVMSLVYSRFDAKTADKYVQFVAPIQNSLKRIAALLSVTYTIPCRRYTQDEELNTLVMKYAPDIEVALGEAERLKNACADAFVIAFWDAVTKRVRYRVEPPHLWSVAHADDGSVDYYESAGVRYRQDGATATEIKGMYGKSMWGPWVQTFKACPVAWFRLAPYGTSVWGISNVKDLVTGTVEIGFSETLNNYGEFLRSFKQPFVQDTGAEESSKRKTQIESLQIGSEHLLPFQIGVVDLGDPSNAHYDQIRKKIADLAATRGISNEMYYSKDTATFATVAISPELRKIWRETTKYQLEPERALLRGVCAVLVRYEMIPASAMDEAWNIDYREPTPEEADPKNALAILRDGIELGVDSAVSYLLRTDRECVTTSQALDKIKANAAVRATVVELMRDLNLPAETTATDEVPLTPEENGSRGGQISAQVRGEYNGKGGPSPLPKNM